MRHIFIIGSKGIPANYGGFETFVDQLVTNQRSKEIKYHVACMANDQKEFEYRGAHCFNVKVPEIKAAKAVYYDMAAFAYCNKYIRRHNIDNPIIYVLACRIGPFLWKYSNQLKKLGGTLYLNPDGHEWKREKWNKLIRKYWKVSEKYMVKHADLVICDSVNIEKYIQKEYSAYQPKTTYIAYGADVNQSKMTDASKEWIEWCEKNQVRANEYYLIVGRFVPENNYETIITEFVHSNTDKDLVIITNVEKNKFYNDLRERTGFEQDTRVKFVGTVYDKELLKKIREEAYGYFHGHEVGGTNPSLLEALASTKLNLLLDVGFNREVAEEGAMYWTKETSDLAKVISDTDGLTSDQILEISIKATQRIKDHYTWMYIVEEYERFFRREK